MKLTGEGIDSYVARAAKGHAAIRTVSRDELATAARDTIADVLTALLGPAGTSSYGGEITYNESAKADAQNVLAHAFDSWVGDAEDYVRLPEPGEYGYEEAS